MSLSKTQKESIMDAFGKLVILNVRDRSLQVSIDIVEQKTVNPVKSKQYKALENLTNDEKESVDNLLSETVTDTIYRFLEMFEEKSDMMKLMINNNGEFYNIIEISEKMGSEITSFDNGWVQKFSKVGRFVL